MKTRLIAILAVTMGVLSGCTETGYHPNYGGARTGDSSSPRKKVVKKPTKKKTTYKPSGKINYAVLSMATSSNTRVIVDIADQKAFLLVSGKIAATSPVSTARTGKYTPRGTFSVTERVRTGKISTIYKVEMPYWMRLSGSPFGMHAGHLPGYPASAGCIRMPADMAKLFYDNT
ncbi:MAG: L,D-transpeptidase family protein, partial [Verrucomicrobiota bacterium]